MSRGANFFEEELLAKLFILLLPEETLEICWKQFWFQSIWWGDAGNCRVIAAGFLKKKKKGFQQIFESESMQISFVNLIFMDRAKRKKILQYLPHVTNLKHGRECPDFVSQDILSKS